MSTSGSTSSRARQVVETDLVGPGRRHLGAVDTRLHEHHPRAHHVETVMTGRSARPPRRSRAPGWPPPPCSSGPAPPAHAVHWVEARRATQGRHGAEHLDARRIAAPATGFIHDHHAASSTFATRASARELRRGGGYASASSSTSENRHQSTSGRPRWAPGQTPHRAPRHSPRTDQRAGQHPHRVGGFPRCVLHHHQRRVELNPRQRAHARLLVKPHPSHRRRNRR